MSHDIMVPPVVKKFSSFRLLPFLAGQNNFIGLSDFLFTESYLFCINVKCKTEHKCSYRHQASAESSTIDSSGDEERDLKLKKALTLLQQRKQLQRNLRALQQQTLSRELPSSTANGKHTRRCGYRICFHLLFYSYLFCLLLRSSIQN